jgi:hypothetical protein
MQMHYRTAQKQSSCSPSARGAGWHPAGLGPMQSCRQLVIDEHQPG